MSGIIPMFFKNKVMLTKDKSLVGLVSFVFFSFVFLILYNKYTCLLTIFELFNLCLISSFVELYTNNGLDNVTIFIETYIYLLII